MLQKFLGVYLHPHPTFSETQPPIWTFVPDLLNMEHILKINWRQVSGTVMSFPSSSAV